MKHAEIKLSEVEAKILLEALQMREDAMQSICDDSDDEDEIADIGNDLVELRLLLAELSRIFVASFGESALNVKNDPL